MATNTVLKTPKAARICRSRNMGLARRLKADGCTNVSMYVHIARAANHRLLRLLKAGL